MLRAVLDANVIVSAAISPLGKPAKILQALHADAFDLVISKSILDEIGRVFRYPKIQKRHGWPEAEVREVVSRFRRMALLTPGTLTLQVITQDDSDNRYLECAVEGSADYIVSGDHHLLDLESYEGIEIVNARGFLQVLRGPNSLREHG